MVKSQDAVPVWIMPLSKITDNFEIANTKFDVLILDEASQSDVTTLLAFAMAKRVIVVGDNEQVTPSAIGLENYEIDSLIKMDSS